LKNFKTALTAYYLFNKQTGINEDILREGLKKVVWPYRLMQVKQDPLILIDVAHNIDGFENIAEHIKNQFHGRKVILLIGLKEEKESTDVISPVLKYCRMGIGIPVFGTKALSGKKMETIFNLFNIPYKHFRSVKSGFNCALENYTNEDLILCAGSHYNINALKKVINSLD
ncbi:glutamate ligase domain-containing protein, partial [candidate division KSB1 bacterium]